MAKDSIYDQVGGCPGCPYVEECVVLTDCAESDGGVIYRVGEWAAPRIAGSKLLAFGSLQNAQDFEDRYPEYPEVDQLYVAMAFVGMIYCYLVR